MKNKRGHKFLEPEKVCPLKIRGVKTVIRDKLIILDEPFVGLDQYMVRQLEQTIKKINKELGVTIVMVTHNFHATLKDTNKVIELSNKGCTSYTTQEYMNINEVK